MLKFEHKTAKLQKGMTYIELIVVVFIFSIITSAIMFNYSKFQARVDIRVLGNDVALKLAEAQKSATAGKWNLSAATSWKPAYGIYFNSTANYRKQLIYLADLNNDNLYSGPTCSGSECLDTVSITKGNYISSLDVFYLNSTSQNVSDMTITFTRPNYGMVVTSSSALSPGISYVQITVSSPTGTVTSPIKLYASGRIQIN